MCLSVTTSMHGQRINRLLLSIAAFAMTFGHLLPILVIRNQFLNLEFKWLTTNSKL
jgi:hypothetical protein